MRRPRIAALALLVLVTGCAPLRRLEDHPPVNPDRALTIVGANGQLSPAMSRKVLARLKGQVAPTDILEKHSLLVEAVTGTPLVAGNLVTLLIDGPATYEAMFKALEAASSSINFETYIFEDDAIGKRFAELLLRKRAAGVEVNLLYDSVGCMGTPAAFFQRLRDGGVRAVEFNPVNPLKLRGHKWILTQRDHRKILVVDGRTVITGGINISNVYTSSLSGLRFRRARGPQIAKAWRDTDVQIEGPAVAEFQRLFLESWARAQGPVSTVDFFPPLPAAGPDLIRVVGSTPGRENRFTYTMYVAAFTYAEKSIHLTTPYFVPDAQILTALTKAAERGVDVTLMVPGAKESVLNYYAGRSYFAGLLKAGVKIHVRRPDSMLHAKTAVIDGIWSTVGSTNMELLSFLNNDEVNAVILSRPFAAALESTFQEDLKQAPAIRAEDWAKRPLLEKVREWCSNLLGHWL